MTLDRRTVTKTALIAWTSDGGQIELDGTTMDGGASGYSLVGCISPGNSPAWASIIPPRTFGLSLTATF